MTGTLAREYPAPSKCVKWLWNPRNPTTTTTEILLLHSPQNRKNKPIYNNMQIMKNI